MDLIEESILQEVKDCKGGIMFLKAIMIILSAMVGLLCVVIFGFMAYSIAWMVRERLHIDDYGEPGDLEIPWGEDYDSKD